MRVHLFDPQLNLVDGHYANYDSAVVAELQRRGIETVVYGHREPNAAIGTKLNARGIFRRDIFEEVGRDQVAWALENFTDLGAEFSADLASVDASEFTSDDLAFFPNILHNQIDGVRTWILSLPEDRRPRLVLKTSYLVHAMPFMMQRPNKDVIQLLFRFGMRRLRASHPRTHLCSDTEEMVKAFGDISGCPINLLPLPLIVPLSGERPANDPLRVAYLGHASMLKGLHFLPDIVRRVGQSDAKAHFDIQLFGSAQLCAQVKGSFAKMPPGNVTLIEGALDEAAYRALLDQADIVLLPYAREFYGWASSGIFTEALSTGKVVVVPDATWLGRQVKQFKSGGAMFSGFDAKGVADALQRAIRSFPELKQRAVEAAPDWSAHHSPARFIDTLLALR